MLALLRVWLAGVAVGHLSGVVAYNGEDTRALFQIVGAYLVECVRLGVVHQSVVGGVLVEGEGGNARIVERGVICAVHLAGQQIGRIRDQSQLLEHGELLFQERFALSALL